MGELQSSTARRSGVDGSSPSPVRATRAVVALDAKASLDKPLRLLKIGKNATVHGTFDLSKQDAQAIVDAFTAWGNDLVVDYEHNTVDPVSNGKVPAAGWIKQGTLELKADGIWATIEWTDAAKAAIVAKEYRYISPTFAYQKNKIVASPTGLLPTALVNYPGTVDMAPLAARATDKRSAEHVQLAAFDAIRSSLQMAIEERYGFGAWVLDVFDDDVVYMLEGRTWQCEYAMDGSAAVLTSEPQEVERTYAPVGSSTGTQMPGENENTEGVAMSKAIYAILGLTAATLAVSGMKEEEAAVAEVSRLQKSERDVMALTGKPTLGEALATLAGWKEAAEAGKLAVAKLSAIEGARSEEQVTAMLDAATKAGKHGLPAKRGAYLKIAGAGDDGKGADVAKLKALLDELPVTTNVGAGHRAPPAAKVEDGSVTTTTEGGVEKPLVIALTAREKRRCTQMGWKESEFAEMKLKLKNAPAIADEEDEAAQ